MVKFCWSTRTEFWFLTTQRNQSNQHAKWFVLWISSSTSLFICFSTFFLWTRNGTPGTESERSGWNLTGFSGSHRILHWNGIYNSGFNSFGDTCEACDPQDTNETFDLPNCMISLNILWTKFPNFTMLNSNERALSMAKFLEQVRKIEEKEVIQTLFTSVGSSSQIKVVNV